MEPSTDMHGGDSLQEGPIHGPGARATVFIWAVLVGLTLLTTQLHGVGLLLPGIVVALAIAASKTVLVSAYYMHMKYERPVIRRIGIMAVVILLWTILLIFADPVFR